MHKISKKAQNFENIQENLNDKEIFQNDANIFKETQKFLKSEEIFK